MLELCSICTPLLWYYSPGPLPLLIRGFVVPRHHITVGPISRNETEGRGRGGAVDVNELPSLCQIPSVDSELATRLATNSIRMPALNAPCRGSLVSFLAHVA